MDSFFAAFFALFFSFFGNGDSNPEPIQEPISPQIPVEPEPPVEPEIPVTDEQQDPPADDSDNGFVPDGYTELVFTDEFNGTSLDRSTWCTRYIYGGGPGLQVPDASCQPNSGAGTLDFLNDERQRYVDYNRSGEAMHVVENGLLTLRATATRTDDSYAGYESAMIRSKDTFRPSNSQSFYVVARVRLPNVVGTWPAFWLNPGADADGNTPWPPEIDILEAPLNGIDDTATMLHQQTQVRGSQTDSGNNEYGYLSADFESTWHNYHSPDGSSLRNRWLEVAAEWKQNSVCFYVDDQLTACENYRWVTNDGTTAPAATLLLNLAIGGQWAGRYGVGDEVRDHLSQAELDAGNLSTAFPAQMQIDYVRVYRKAL